MKAKTLVILLLVLGILAGAAVWLSRSRESRTPKAALGGLLFEEFPANQIAAISLNGPEGTVSLVREEGRWVVENRFHYPADFSRIRGLVRKVKSLKIGRRFASSEEILSRLGLKEPGAPGAPKEEQGTRITFKGKDGKTIAGLLLGKIRKTGEGQNFPNGQYVRPNNEGMIYLVDQAFSALENEPAAWLEKQLLEVKEEEIAEISCRGGDRTRPRYVLRREKKGKPLVPIDFPPGSKIDKSALNRLARALSSLRLRDVLDPKTDPDSVGMGSPYELDYRLFNGMVYRVFPSHECSAEEPCYLKLAVDYQPPPLKGKTAEEGVTTEEKEDRSGKKPEEFARKAKGLNERVGAWIYEISNWQHGSFFTDPQALLEKATGSKNK